jgi:rfaE bifunctional protein nucleotidyltransferase chain/domain
VERQGLINTKRFLPTRAVPSHNHIVNFREKIISWDSLPGWREKVRASGKRLVVTNGCFDLLHLGHVTYLEAGRQLGDILLVGVNGDKSVQELKGPGRPVNCESDRAAVLAALESVGAVCIFSERTASRFLAVAQPDIYLKGGDYTIETINQEERRLVESTGGKVTIMPIVKGRSTTEVLKKIARL